MADPPADTLLLPDKSQMPGLALGPELFLDRTTVLYGPTRTGKTVLVKVIMGVLRPLVEQVLVVSPTEAANRGYAGFVSPVLIHGSMGAPDPGDRRDTERKAAQRFLKAVVARQEMMASVYKQANEFAPLLALFRRIPPASRGDYGRLIGAVEKKKRAALAAIEREYVRAPARGAAEAKKAVEASREMVLKMVKRFVEAHAEELWARGDLAPRERRALEYVGFNPRLLLVFDDCAADLKGLGLDKIPELRKLFYQGRHIYTSVVICCQDETDLPANLRKNAYVSVFTDRATADTNFERRSNGYTKADAAYVKQALDAVFVGHRKLVYIRDDPTRRRFYHFTGVEPAPFAFGSRALHELCARVEATDETVDTSNPYFETFAHR